MQADIKGKELVTLAECDKILSGKKGAKKQGTMSEAVSGTEGIRGWRYHMDGIPKLCSDFSTNTKTGLQEAEAIMKHKEVGDNALSQKDVKPWYCVFFEEMTGFFSLLLWAGSILCFIGYGIQDEKEDLSNLYLGSVLAIVTFLTGCFSYAQTSKSAEMMA